jgi:hypothetical protein
MVLDCLGRKTFGNFPNYVTSHGRDGALRHPGWEFPKNSRLESVAARWASEKRLASAGCSLSAPILMGGERVRVR